MADLHQLHRELGFLFTEGEGTDQQRLGDFEDLGRRIHDALDEYLNSPGIQSFRWRPSTGAAAIGEVQRRLHALEQRLKAVEKMLESDTHASRESDIVGRFLDVEGKLEALLEHTGTDPEFDPDTETYDIREKLGA